MRLIYGRTKPIKGAKINWSHPLSKKLVACWIMNEGVGTRIYDLSGNGNTGTFTNMSDPPTTTSGWNPGKFGRTLMFDGSDDYVNCGNNAVLNPGLSDFSLAAWIKTPSAGAGYPRIVDKVFGSAYCFHIIPAGQLGLAIYGIYQGSRSGSKYLFDNQWHFVAVSAKRNGLARYYVDGVDDGNPYDISSVKSSNLKNSYNLQIGLWSGDKFKGLIDGVYIWNRALSDNEVLQLYKEPFAMFYKR